MSACSSWIRNGLGLSLLCAAFGCGGGGDQTRGAKLDLPPNAKLASLTPADGMKVCAFLLESAKQITDADQARYTCVITGGIASSQIGPDGRDVIDRAKCQQAMNECLAVETPAHVDTSCGGSSYYARLSACSATAAELQDCINAAFAEQHRIYSTLSCAELTPGSGAVPFMLPDPDAQSLPECQALTTQCPAVLQGMYSPTGSTPMSSPTGCDDSCVHANDGFCDDGGPGAIRVASCALGTDCSDCGPR